MKRPLKIKVIISSIVMVIVILGGTLFDAVFIRSYTFGGYIIICTWEFVIFFFGFLFGTMLERGS